jgi:hypothetical protein
MPLDQETINAQLELLATHRRTLAHLLQQAAQFSAGYMPAHIINGIIEARAHIQQIKSTLRENSVQVGDEPSDAETHPAGAIQQQAVSNGIGDIQVMDDQQPRKLRVFLCHSSGDKPAVRDLYRRLENVGIKSWLDEEDLLPGQDWQREIPRAVRNSDVVIVCLSRSSITRSGYVQKEIKFALDVADKQPEDTIFIIPLRLDECKVPERLRKWQWVNFNDARGFERLLRALRLRADSIGKAGVSVPVMPPPDKKISSQSDEALQVPKLLSPSAPNEAHKTATPTLSQSKRITQWRPIWRPWGDFPAVVIITVIVALIAIISWITGIGSLGQLISGLLPSSPTSAVVKTPTIQIQPTALVGASVQVPTAGAPATAAPTIEPTSAPTARPTSSSGSATATSVSPTNLPEASPNAREVSIGTELQANGWGYTYPNASYALVRGKQVGRFTAQGTYIAITVWVKNNTGKLQPIPALFFALKDAQGNVYTCQPQVSSAAVKRGVNADVGMEDSITANGVATSVYLVFDVPAGTQELFLFATGKNDQGWPLNIVP